ncbi:DUF3899 domain-containing protein [Candidatus Xianfuyuplasma coldseepsis]|uniref:DUF3899 domain-containing protein n=1 Tax=Candidatus Xianfuyuplasma coldseepsis TaxID=2782163 RepID=A0A7L7KRW5_9MOLU|nr:DUF3899 domain-containing protein [Xianfuyuplasma coldseepsis]QMS85345.1 DUF3899 domain-containing protein [Xianfuyuplasma coldseepsis]
MKLGRFIIILVLLVLVFLLVHYIVFIRGFSKEFGDVDALSNSLFIVGVLGFFPGLMAHLNTGQFFYGFQYSFRSVVSGDFKKRFPSLSDYIMYKKRDVRDTVYLEIMIAAALLIVASIYFAMQWDYPS